MRGDSKVSSARDFPTFPSGSRCKRPCWQCVAAEPQVAEGGAEMVPQNPFIELMIGTIIIIFWFPLISFGAYRVMRWMLDRFDPM